MARIEVPMPQMGESIAEGTVSKWLKKVGDTVARDEPLLEISTDKVDAEIPSPAAGTLVEILVNEGETVEVGTVVAYLDTEAGAAVQPAEAAPAPAAAAPAPAPAPEAPPAAAPEPAAPAPAAEAAPATEEDRLRQRSSPLVRRIAAEHGVDLAQVRGTGQGGRVTKQDIMAFIEGRQAAAQAAPAAPARPAAPAPAAAPARRPAEGPVPVEQFWDIFYGQVQHPEFPEREGDDRVPMDRIRRLTADHMVRAKRIAPHVHSVIEIDFTRIDRIRRANRARWEQQGTRVSFTAFVAWAVSRTLQEFPMVNATISGNDILYRGDINIGMADRKSGV